MEPQSTDKPAEAPGGTAPLPGGGHARSSLSLPGGPGGASGAGGTAATAPISLQEGVSRARNIAHAAFMIVVLLVRYFFVKVVGPHLYRLFVRVMLVVGRVVELLWRLAAPRLAALRTRAAQTGNKAVRLALLSLITVMVPLERVASLLIKSAKVHGSRLAAQSATSAIQVLAPLLSGLWQVARAGFQAAVVRKVLMRLIKILEEAQR